MSEPSQEKKIIVQIDGAYELNGNIPLVKKIQVVSEYGEPLNWKKEGEIKTSEPYYLCRCGHSRHMPFCDSTHFEINFDGTETADTADSTSRRQDCPPGQGMVVRQDKYLCTESGFCGNRNTNIDQMMADTDEPAVRAEIMAMIDRCPSGSYTYALDETGPDIEADLPQQVAVTTEILSEGPVLGPLWVTGNIPIERADGKKFETRNRVTLCCCGRSENKPLCDGAHRCTEKSRP